MSIRTGTIESKGTQRSTKRKRIFIVIGIVLLFVLVVILFVYLFFIRSYKGETTLFHVSNPNKAVQQANQNTQFSHDWCNVEYPDGGGPVGYIEDGWKNPNKIWRCTYDNAYIVYRVLHSSYYNSEGDSIFYLGADGNKIVECARNYAKIDNSSLGNGICLDFHKHVQCDETKDICI